MVLLLRADAHWSFPDPVLARGGYAYGSRDRNRRYWLGYHLLLSLVDDLENDALRLPPSPHTARTPLRSALAQNAGANRTKSPRALLPAPRASPRPWVEALRHVQARKVDAAVEKTARQLVLVLRHCADACWSLSEVGWLDDRRVNVALPEYAR